MAVPADTPVTIPVAEPTVATDVAEEAHVPPEAVLVSVVLAEGHTVAVPDIVPALTVFTVTILVAEVVPQLPEIL